MVRDWSCGWLNGVLWLGLSQGRQLNYYYKANRSINNQVSVCLSEVFLCQLNSELQRMRKHSWCLVQTNSDATGHWLRNPPN